MTKTSIRVITVVTMLLSVSACASSRPFDRLLAEQRWADAAQLFGADSTLLNDEQSLYSAAVLFGSPSKRATYNPERARTLLQRLLTTFPNSRYVSDARDRLALLDEASLARTGTARVRELEARIAELMSQQARLRAGLDSAQTLGDALKRNAARLEADVRDRDEQLRALRLELKQLKEIDLKPRSAGQRPPAE